MPDLLPNKTEDRFGALFVEAPFTIGSYLVRPVPDLEKAKLYAFEHLEKREFLYPPRRHIATPDQCGHVEHPGIPEFHTPIITSSICRQDGEPLPDDFRSTDGRMILGLLGVIYDTQIEFENWWWVDRVTINKSIHLWIHQPDLEIALTQAFDTWNGWPQDSKDLFVNCCAFYSRSLVYQWRYEKFTALYTCIDALWRLNADGSPNLKANHSERISKMIEHFSLFNDSDSVQKLVRRRNNLFHEARWGGGPPMTEDSDGIHLSRQLKELVQRLIFASIGLTNSFVFTEWIGHRGWKDWEAKSGIPTNFFESKRNRDT